MSSLDLQRSFDCSDVERFADAYIDGEFEAPERQVLEEHLAGCAHCSVELQRLAALRALLRARVGPSLLAPEALRQRISLGLREVDQQLAAGVAGFGRNFVWRRALWPLVVGASAAGALAFAYAVVVPQRSDRWVVGDAVEMHARALPLEISTGQLDQLMPLFEQHLGFAVRPPSFQGAQFRLEGGRLWHLGPHDAAYIQYGDPRNRGRLSLFIVEDPGASIHLTDARRTQLGEREVFLTHAHGHNVAVWRNQDVVYSLVSDLGEAETLSLLDGTR